MADERCPECGSADIVHEGGGAYVCNSCLAPFALPAVVQIQDYEKDERLALWFTPQAIRDHYEADDDDPTKGLSDEELAAVGEQALTDDGLYRAFHSALEWALGRED